MSCYFIWNVNMLNFLGLKLIRFYQKFISPYKGYSCAYSKYTGKKSCSNYGARVMKKNLNFFVALKLIRRRLDRCAYVNKQNFIKQSQIQSQNLNKKFASQAGFCDCGGCDVPACDLPSCELPSCHFSSCETLDVLSCGCDVLDCGGGESGSTKEQKRMDDRKKRRDEKNNQNEVVADNDSEDGSD